ncbi:HNH endonuclease [Aeromonas sp.]|uniref:HNH endonuclease n=1 Tax=Aeromonas sp. TaxID=647 RepID=UPI002587830F|nr:HNH endonuclease [Aeromonas sp.]
MSDAICSIDGCENKIKCKGLCSKHYQRFIKHGDAEAFKSKRFFGCLVPGCNGKHRSKGYCMKHYHRLRANGDAQRVSIIVGDDKKRIVDSVVVSEAGCWVWQKRIHDGGYGITSLNGRLEMAHRASWMVFVGAIPTGVQVNHTCHNRACVNPEHLYLGSQVDNMRDMTDAGRENRAIGQRNGSALLTPEKVLQIRSLIEAGRKIKDIAVIYGISPTTVSAIKGKKTWGWLE